MRYFRMRLMDYNKRSQYVAKYYVMMIQTFLFLFVSALNAHFPNQHILIIHVIMINQFTWVLVLLIRRGGDIETNPEPRPNPYHSFLICHWNLNGPTAHNYLNVLLFTGIGCY